MKRPLPCLALAALCLVASPHHAQAEDPPPVKVFILAGQSNMQGHAHIRTMDVMAKDPKTAPLLELMRDSDGSPWTSERTWIASIGSSETPKTGALTAGFGPEKGGPKFGPEFAFGLFAERAFPDHPILIIKTAWGGKSLHTDFRPPGAPPYAFNENQLKQIEDKGQDLEEMQAAKAEASGHYYRLMMDYVKQVLADPKQVYPDYDPDQGFELGGFVWFQGWNDMVDRGNYPTRDQPGGYDNYSVLLAQFIRDVRKDLESPELPFVIGVMGAGGPTKLYGPDQKRYQGIHQNFRDAMAAPASLPEFQDNVATVLTENFWDLELTALRQEERAMKKEIDAIRADMKDGKTTGAEGDAAIEALYAEAFTEEELDLLRNGASNAEFHYLGSAKIMSQIGKGFAEAVAELQ